MNVSIVSIGNELLNGHTIDTNTHWLCERLLETGIAVTGAWVVPDEHDRIIQSLAQASQCAELVLVTGGLGPTDDDITRRAVADYLGVPLEFRQELVTHLEAFFAARRRTMAPKNLLQVYIPQGADILANPKGTAAGFWFENNQLKMAVMPGVPAEMELMFSSHVLPRIARSHEGPVVVNAKVRCLGLGESDIAQRLDGLMHRGRNPLINSTCGAGDVILHISATAQNRDEAMHLIEQDKHLLSQRLGNCIYGYDEQTMAGVVGELLRQKRKTISVAESCTGGLICQLLTEIPGSSDYFVAGWVTYSNAAKISQLDVTEQMIVQHGAVSLPVAAAMAAGAAHKSGSDVAIAVTGIAGPGGGTAEKPVGLVFIAVSVLGQCEVHEFRFPPVSRQWVRLRAALAALNLLRLQL